ncbi:PEP/pyruvate-binding domain-containing protein [Desulfonatronovibrio magnus]|uniref:PEP/pyruvate-binding domain-containing protein n=1 Tax=Desulfonatronovibrio magnus TaxID=698827 RepID=UPI0006988585|nr:PEP/pyruvate-binding domain-containing protein [Desulfonatronovibrio magnus]RQD60263.1 MAG: pyruvate, phosphate dikinase [Desulfonatronovibrio sp. MSAO_Bac4]
MRKAIEYVLDNLKIRMKIEDVDDADVKKKYDYFTSLLAGNNKALSLINDLENLLIEPKPFDYDEVVEQCEKLVSVVYDISEDLNAISNGKYQGIFSATERIGTEIISDLATKKKLDKSSWTIPLENLTNDNHPQVGNKAANLAEISNRAELPTPQGFAITAFACHHFFKQAEIYSMIRDEMKGLDPDDTENLEKACNRIQSIIMDARIPTGLDKSIKREISRLQDRLGDDIRLAFRSSATGEDSEGTSFAGQHSSVLNVSMSNALRAYKEVVASTFNPRAVFYRRKIGYRDVDVLMSVLCLVMVDARASGCLYTIDPNNADVDDIYINANWGLGVSVVDGSMPTDYWRISKEDRSIMMEEIAVKDQMMVMDSEYDLKTVPVPETDAAVPCLSPENIACLVEFGLRLEEHFGWPLDMEWAVDKKGKAYVLQARPLYRAMQESPINALDRDFDDQEHEIVLAGGMTASPGTASGPAYVLESEHNLSNIPQDSILVAPQTSPLYVSAMSRVKGIITDVGSVTGHMASVAREFGIPTLVGTSTGTQAIEPYETITLDASRRIVFKGRVENILKERPRPNLMKSSPAYKTVQKTLKQIVPLKLVDPAAENFTPEGCITLHDIVRFAHEMAMREMFRLGDDIQGRGKYMAVRLKTSLPLNIYFLDLGGGAALEPGKMKVTKRDITSSPFKALLNGMSYKEVKWAGRLRKKVKGLKAAFWEKISGDPDREIDLSTPNYAIISDEYVNFNLRLGHQYVTIDSFCSPRINDNYIKLSFKGGKEDPEQRTRRATLIALILKKMGFRVEHKGDMLMAEMKKYDESRTREKLDIIGRLLGSIRLLDTILNNDSELRWYADEFLRGNYSFKSN